MEENLARYITDRGRVIHDFASVEYLMICLVSRSYFGKDGNKRFEDEMLSDKYFTFYLLQSVFMKVLKKDFPGEKLSRTVLQNFGESRNKLAHSMLVTSGTDKSQYLKTSQGFKPFYDLYNKFYDNYFIIVPLLNRLLKERYDFELSSHLLKDPLP